MRTSRSNFSSLPPAPSSRREAPTLPPLAPAYDALPRATTLQGAMQNARHFLQHRSITTPEDRDLASGLQAALAALQRSAGPSTGQADASFPATTRRPDESAVSPAVGAHHRAPGDTGVFPTVALQNIGVPQSIREIIGPVIRGIGKRFLPGFNSSIIGTYRSSDIGQPLGKTIRNYEERSALVLLNLDVSADIDNATAEQRQASHAATLAHEYLRHVIPFMRALSQDTEEESDDEEHRQIFLPADIDTNAFYREMCDVCDELPERLQTQFMQSYANSIATQIDKLATDSVKDDADDFHDDVINSHGLK
jgi:hypothetical protein